MGCASIVERKSNVLLTGEQLLPAALLLRSAIAVTITVAITIAVTIFLGLRTTVVDNDAEVIENLLLVQAFQFGKETTVNLRLAQNIYGEVRHTIDNTGISHRLSRHIVDDNIVVILLQILDALLQISYSCFC